jgi:protocatechuate 3,4-dioxygenase alpha subunit
MPLSITPSQTIGPFSHEAWRWACTLSDAITAGAESIRIAGIIRDGDGVAVDDAMIEAWAPAGRDHPAEAVRALAGFRRTPSGADGSFQLILPRPAAGAIGEPVAWITVFARGLVLHQFSAVFLDDDPGLADSAIMQQVPAARRATLVARKTGEASYQWDIRLQGGDETVFFDYA